MLGMATKRLLLARAMMHLAMDNILEKELPCEVSSLVLLLKSETITDVVVAQVGGG